MEEIKYSCQVCGTNETSPQFLKCEQCSRDLCWNHFEGLGMVGRVVCPYCDGSLVFLPKYCEKCHIDYIRIPKSKDSCEFCGYPLKVKDYLNRYFKSYLTIQERALEPKQVEDDYTKDSKPN